MHKYARNSSNCLSFFAVFLASILLSGCTDLSRKGSSDSGEIPLFNGKNLDGWYTVLKTKGINKDTEGIFKVEDGLIHILGKEFGYLCSKKEFENYHLTVEFKWGAKKFPPRENAKRDSGILYHFPADKRDEVWPYSIECQIQEGDCGDIWLVGPAVTANGQRFDKKYDRIVKTRDAEKPWGQWNTMEVIADGSKCTHIVNGVIVNEATDTNVRKGKILLQSEGAEIWYRKVSLKPLRP